MPWPVMAKLLSIIPSDMTEWATINWLFETRRRLDGVCPADRLASEPQKVIEAAINDFEPPLSSW